MCSSDLLRASLRALHQPPAQRRQRGQQRQHPQRPPPANGSRGSQSGFRQLGRSHDEGGNSWKPERPLILLAAARKASPDAIKLCKAARPRQQRRRIRARGAGAQRGDQGELRLPGCIKKKSKFKGPELRFDQFLLGHYAINSAANSAFSLCYCRTGRPHSWRGHWVWQPGRIG